MLKKFAIAKAQDPPAAFWFNFNIASFNPMAGMIMYPNH